MVTELPLLEETTLTCEKLIEIGDVWKALRKIFDLSCVWNYWLKSFENYSDLNKTIHFLECPFLVDKDLEKLMMVMFRKLFERSFI